MKERNKTLQELCLSSNFFYSDIQKYDEKAAKKFFVRENINILLALKNNLNKIQNWTSENIHSEIKSTADEFDLKMGKVAPPLRLAVTGGADSPSIDVTLFLLGKEKTFIRIEQAIETIETSV